MIVEERTYFFGYERKDSFSVILGHFLLNELHLQLITVKFVIGPVAVALALALAQLREDDQCLHTVLDDHPPELIRRVLHWVLGHNEGQRVVVALNEGSVYVERLVFAGHRRT